MRAPTHLLHESLGNWLTAGEQGPWTLRETWPDGRQATYPWCPGLLFDDRAEAQQWADWANRSGNNQGVVLDVVPVQS